MKYNEIISKLRSMQNPRNIEGMKRFGIQGKEMLGISMPVIRKTAKQIGKDHVLAQKLWSSEIYEARMIAYLIDDPKQVTEKQMEKWVKDFVNQVIKGQQTGLDEEINQLAIKSGLAGIINKFIKPFEQV